MVGSSAEQLVENFEGSCCEDANLTVSESFRGPESQGGETAKTCYLFGDVISAGNACS